MKSLRAFTILEGIFANVKPCGTSYIWRFCKKILFAKSPSINKNRFNSFHSTCSELFRKLGLLWELRQQKEWNRRALSLCHFDSASVTKISDADNVIQSLTMDELAYIVRQAHYDLASYPKPISVIETIGTLINWQIGILANFLIFKSPHFLILSSHFHILLT